jgi:two-component system, NtrC family, sensor kinase
VRAADQVRHLPWLAPSTPALAALATAKHPWDDPVVRQDPGAVALLLRFQKSSAKPTLEITSGERADLIRFAVKRLRAKPAGKSRYNDAVEMSLRIAELAARFVDGEIAEAVRTVGLLTAIGPSLIHSPASKHLDITVRLTRRWGLPGWCITALCGLNHPASVAESLGADRRIVAAVRAAAWLLEPRLLGGLEAETLSEAGIDPVTARQLANEIPILAVQPHESPYDAPLLLDLLRASERNHRRDDGELLQSLECEVGRLHATLADRQRTETDRLRTRKLVAVAEFAAGAGHEINTPLAIISGQAQLLLQNEDDAERRKSLEAVVQQTRRVHDILTDLMQFARPPKPVPQVFDLGVVVHETTEAFRELAAERGIDLDLAPNSHVAYADPRQFRTALGSLVRNAIEATPDRGWIGIRAIEVDGELQVIVDDSGPRPDPAIIDHLFDPFFSGRPAGRGRGLGLPTAWRLAREQGGDVRYEATDGGPTRFVLTLPRAEALPAPERMSA